MRRLPKLFKVSLLVLGWLVFGGAYIVDALDASYEMNAAGSVLEQALEPEDKIGPNGFNGSIATLVPTLTSCLSFDTGPEPGLSARLFLKSTPQPLYQVLSVYRI